jgi:hypothetical protein
MRALLAALAVAAVVASGAIIVAEVHDPRGDRTIANHGVEVRVPGDWSEVPSTGDGQVVDPVTVLVVGTVGARPRASPCQVVSYRVPPDGAVVVVVRWRTETSGGGAPPRSRGALDGIRLNRLGFDCWPGHLGGAAQIALEGHAYQVNVLIGDRTGTERVAEALSVARSFDVVR